MTRVLMTVDAVGGVWRYAMDLAQGLSRSGFKFVFAVLGPAPTSYQLEEARGIGPVVALDVPLDWLAEDARALDALPPLLSGLVDRHEIDLVHLNAPTQAAGLALHVPILVVSHSCVPTWFATVRRSGLPEGWGWQLERNRAGLIGADVVVAPSQAHGAALRDVYGQIGSVDIVHNGIRSGPTSVDKAPFVLSVGRWWDDGKNGQVLDAAAGSLSWPLITVGAATGPDGAGLTFRNTRHLGSRPHGEVKSLMAEAAIICSPSVYEPFGLAALEGAAAQGTLVLSDIPTYRELWDGAAEFFDPLQPAALANVVERLAADPERRRQLGAAAGERARNYQLDAQVARMCDLYTSTLSRPLRRSA